ncbi:hypothetical protein NDU88_004080, partial [Pleurodeles waltl]
TSENLLIRVLNEKRQCRGCRSAQWARHRTSGGSQLKREQQLKVLELAPKG